MEDTKMLSEPLDQPDENPLDISRTDSEILFGPHSKPAE